MLIDPTTGRKITNMPFASDFRVAMSRLTQDEIDAMKVELNARIEGGEIHTAGWMPGSDWTNTPFQPLYEKSAQMNVEMAARMFGLVVWQVFMERPERWGSGRYEKDGKAIGSRTYFLLR